MENAPKDILAPGVNQLVWDLSYKGVWDMNKKLLVERKKDFQSVLKATNNMTLTELRRLPRGELRGRPSAGVGEGSGGAARTAPQG